MSGAERIGAAFAAARAEGRAALMPYMMGGFPDDDTSAAVAGAYADAGADLIELGVPFSDPLADGPVIHAAATEALAAGATLDSVLDIGAAIADRVPVVTMAYANMVLARGVAEFAARAAEAGLAGVIVPDLPPEEAVDARGAFNERGLALVPLVAPTTPPERRRAICRDAQGFVYLVSDTRTTGERDRAAAGARRSDRGDQAGLLGARRRGFRHRHRGAGCCGRGGRRRRDRGLAAGPRGRRGGGADRRTGRGGRLHRRRPHGDEPPTRRISRLNNAGPSSSPYGLRLG